MGAEVVCTACCEIIREEMPLSEGSRQPFAMQQLFECTRHPQSYATSTRTYQAPGVFPADLLSLVIGKVVAPVALFSLIALSPVTTLGMVDIIESCDFVSVAFPRSSLVWSTPPLSTPYGFVRWPQYSQPSFSDSPHHGLR